MDSREEIRKILKIDNGYKEYLSLEEWQKLHLIYSLKAIGNANNMKPNDLSGFFGWVFGEIRQIQIENPINDYDSNAKG